MHLDASDCQVIKTLDYIFVLPKSENVDILYKGGKYTIPFRLAVIVFYYMKHKYDFNILDAYFNHENPNNKLITYRIKRLDILSLKTYTSSPLNTSRPSSGIYLNQLYIVFTKPYKDNMFNFDDSLVPG